MSADVSDLLDPPIEALDPDGVRSFAQATKKEKQDFFLELIRDRALLDKDAAYLCGVHRMTASMWKRDPEFLARYKEARRIATPQLIAEAERRAINGSDRMLEFLLLNYAPDKFRRKEQLDLGNADGKPLVIEDASKAERIAAILAAAKARQVPLDDLV